jgi:hypothetical protein
MSGDNHARDVLLAELQTTSLLLVEGQTFQIAYLCISKNLNTFTCEISKKTGKSEAGPVDGGFADLALEAESRSNQFKLKRLRVPRIEFADWDKR